MYFDHINQSLCDVLSALSLSKRNDSLLAKCARRLESNYQPSLIQYYYSSLYIILEIYTSTSNI